jgi:hypothetical protein
MGRLDINDVFDEEVFAEGIVIGDLGSERAPEPEQALQNTIAATPPSLRKSPRKRQREIYYIEPKPGVLERMLAFERRVDDAIRPLEKRIGRVAHRVGRRIRKVTDGIDHRTDEFFRKRRRARRRKRHKRRGH